MELRMEIKLEKWKHKKIPENYINPENRLQEGKLTHSSIKRDYV